MLASSILVTSITIYKFFTKDFTPVLYTKQFSSSNQIVIDESSTFVAKCLQQKLMKIMWPVVDSNSWPAGYEFSTLTTAL